MKWTLLSLLGTLVIAGVVLWWMVTAKPDYWRVLDGDDPAIRTAGERVEQAVSSLITRVRPTGQRWQLPLTEQNVNHWLAARMPNWLANQNVAPDIIAALRRAHVHIDAAHVYLAVQPDLGAVDPVIELTLEPRRADSGPVELHLVAAQVGAFDVPLDTVIEQFANNRHVPRTLTLSVPLKDGREVHVVDMGLADGAMTLTCTTRRVSADD